MTITVLHNQTLLDIAIQATGKAENFLKIAMYNNLVPTDVLVPGSVLKIPETIEIDTDIVRYYKSNKILTATALTEIVAKSVVLDCEQELYECFKD